MTQCPLCPATLHEREAMNSLSRYVRDYICSRCGNKEALGLTIVSDERGVAAYTDSSRTLGVVAALESGGFVHLWPTPSADQDWIDAYVAAVNERHGISKDRQLEIVGASMFGARS